ncbi:MAG: alpha/beta fold hydrolase [Pseudomonadales bacterium]
MDVHASVYKSEADRRRVHDLYRAELDAWPVAHDEIVVPTRMGDTFVVASGPEDGPAVLLLHGTMATAAMWREEMPVLAAGRRVFAVDVIGDAGFSAPARPALTTDAHALWLLDVLAGLGGSHVHLVGLSFGGWVAIDFASRCPDRVSSLTLITPGGVADRNVLVWALPLLVLGSWGAKKVMQRILGPAPAVRSEDQQRLGALSAAIFEGMRPRTGGLRTFTDDVLARLQMPTLVLLGAEDVTMDSGAIAQRFRRLVPGATVEVLAGKRHFLGDQSAAIDGFLRGARRAAS